MAYAKRSLKKKTTKKRSSMKRKAPKASVTSRGRNQSVASHRQTGYARAVLDPKDGPLVGVPQFVPIDTHRVRAVRPKRQDVRTGVVDTRIGVASKTVSRKGLRPAIRSYRPAGREPITSGINTPTQDPTLGEP